MRRITLHPGAWTAFVSLNLAGLAAVVSAQATQHLLTEVGWASVIAGWLIAIWAIKFNNKHWWRTVFEGRLPPQIYLSVPLPIGGWKRKLYILTWDADGLHLNFRGDGPYHGWPPSPPKEKTITIEILNAGPGDARHIDLAWSLPGVDVGTLVHQCGLFGDDLNIDFEDNRLRLSKPERGMVMGILAHAKGPVLPIIKEGQTVVVEAPEPFTNAYVLCCLARAKRRSERTPLANDTTLDFATSIKHMELSGLADVPQIKLEYVSDRGKCVQSFGLHGWMTGGGAPISQKMHDDGSYHTVAGGFSASIDNVMVISNEQK